MYTTKSLLLDHWIPIRLEKVSSRGSGEVKTAKIQQIVKVEGNSCTHPAPPQVIDTKITRTVSSI
jgi:hypothetical protein